MPSSDVTKYRNLDWLVGCLLQYIQISSNMTLSKSSSDSRARLSLVPARDEPRRISVEHHQLAVCPS